MTEVGLLEYPGAQKAALHGLTDLFAVAGQQAVSLGISGFRISHWRQIGSELHCSFDSHPSEDHALTAAIVPGTMEGVPPFPNMDLCLEWLQVQHSRGVTICSVCGGAFVLAASGLLCGRATTTHWMFGEALAREYPKVKVDCDQLLIDDGDIITAGGIMAWIDLGLKLVHRYAGPNVMLETARFFLVDPPGREQRFYSTFTPNLTHGDQSVLHLQHWLQQNFAQPHSVSEMAERIQLGERTFLRRFQRATGLKPTEYVQSLRVGKAREALETTTDSVNEIAWKVGYEDPGAFRKIFRRIMGLSPRDYRRRFSAFAADDYR